MIKVCQEMVISMKFDLCSHHVIQRLTEFYKVINGRFIPFVCDSYDDHSLSLYRQDGMCI